MRLPLEPAQERRYTRPAITTTSQLAPMKVRGLHGSTMNRPQAVEWHLRSGPSSPRSYVKTTSSPRTTSFVDQSFHRMSHKFSPVDGGLADYRDPLNAAGYDHQRFCWQASRLSIVSPIAWHRPYTPLDANAVSGASMWGYNGPESPRATSRMPKTSRTIDFWQ